MGEARRWQSEEAKMAHWKRLTRTKGQLRREAGETQAIDVNMDTVIHMQGFKDHTTIYFCVSSAEGVSSLSVEETPEQIHRAAPVPSQ
jgi:hypothetical protein